jgi:hypothetical protein
MSRITLIFAAAILCVIFPVPERGQDPNTPLNLGLLCTVECPKPVIPCNGCRVAVRPGDSDSIFACQAPHLERHYSVTWSGGKTWTVRFTGKSPCQRKNFDEKHPVCELVGPPRGYRYVARMSGCSRTLGLFLTVVQ